MTFSGAVGGVDGSDILLSGSAQAVLEDITCPTEDSCLVTYTTRRRGDTVLVVLDDDSITDTTGTPLGGVGLQNGNAAYHFPAPLPPPSNNAPDDGQAGYMSVVARRWHSRVGTALW